jgi:hypothetical protein
MSNKSSFYYLSKIGLSDAEILLYVYLADLGAKEIDVHIPNKRLLGITGWSEKKLFKAKRLLLNKGLLIINRNKDADHNGNLSNSYRLCNDSYLQQLFLSQNF